MVAIALRFPNLSAKLRSVVDRHGVTISAVLLLVLLAWLISKWTWLFLQPKEVIAPPVTSTKVDIDSAAERIVSTHLFGVAGERAETAEAQISTLNLRLKGVFSFSPKSPIFAIVNTGTKTDEAFKIGQQIVPGVVLNEVQPTHILVKRGGLLERINIEDRAENLSGAPATRNQFRPPSAPAAMPGNFNLSRNEIAANMQDPRQLSNMGRINANPGGGVVLDDVPPGSFVERFGLQPGDVIRNINGNPVNSQADLARLSQQLAQTQQIRVEGTRGGRPLNLNFNMQQ